MSELDRVQALLQAEFGTANLQLEQSEDVLWIRRGTEKVALAMTDVVISDLSRREQLVSWIRTGEAMVILFGFAEAEARRSLLERGIYEIFGPEPDPITLANSVSNALDFQRHRVRLAGNAVQIRRSRVELNDFIDSARAISSERDLDSLYDILLSKFRELTHADAATLYLVQGNGPMDGRFLSFEHAQNDSVHFESKKFEIPISRSSMAGAAALDGEVINIPDVRNMDESLGFRHNMSFDEQTGYQTISVVSVPMITQKGEVVGVLQLINKKRNFRELLFEPKDFVEQVVPFDARSIALVRIFAAQAAASLENTRLYNEITDILEGFVTAAVHAIEQRDPPTSGHSNRVAELTCELARRVEQSESGSFAEVRFTAQEMKELRYAALLHDFGKIGVPEAVLTKQKKLTAQELESLEARFETAKLAAALDMYRALDAGADKESARSTYEHHRERLDEAWKLVIRANEPRVLAADMVDDVRGLAELHFVSSSGDAQRLVTDREIECLSIPRGSLTREEFGQIRSHAKKTDEFLSRIPWGEAFANLPMIASSHHERPDGKGYPRGWLDHEIPLKAKMMAVADVFDALTAADRPYKKAVPLDRALSIIEMEGRAGALDPDLVRLFVDQRVFECLGIQAEKSA